MNLLWLHKKLRLLLFLQYKEFANSLKIMVGKKIKEGLTEKEIYRFFQDKYGEWILYDPKFGKNTYFLWLLPLFLFVIGGAIVFKRFIIKKN